jgi:DNA recombination-dependent growth factor C
MSFEQHIQQWVSIDNQMKQLTDQVKILRDKKNTLNDTIFSHVENSNLANSVIQISDGKIKFIKTKDTQVLTFKYLETCLHEIIKNDDQVNKIIEYVKNKRDVKYVAEIKRFYNN